MRKIELDWETIDPLLGLMHDSEIAAMHNADRCLIRNRRVALGIPALQVKKELDWKTIDPMLGVIPDQQIAAMYNVSKGFIRMRRVSLGILAVPKDKNMDWKTIDSLLKVMSDRKIASMYKVSKSFIRKRRIALGIPAYSKDQERDWSLIDPLLIDGVASIKELSLRFNIDEQTLFSRRRRKLGIIIPKSEFPWPEIDPLLGKVPDGELAKEFNIMTEAVFRRRKELGIPAYQFRSKIDWSLIDPHLGNIPDSELAERAGISKSAVVSRRQRFDIPPFSGVSNKKKCKIDWETIYPYLGTTTDRELAKKFNVSTASIWRMRIMMNIKAFSQPVDWEKTAHLFGELSDMEIAKIHNVSRPAANLARKKFGLTKPKKDLSYIDQYLDSLSDTEIAEKFGLRRISVYHRRYLVNKRKSKNN